MAHPIDLHPGAQIAANQFDQSLVGDMPGNPYHEDVVIDLIEEFRQVDIHCHFIPCFDEPFDLADRAMGIALRTEAIARF